MQFDKVKLRILSLPWRKANIYPISNMLVVSRVGTWFVRGGGAVLKLVSLQITLQGTAPLTKSFVLYL